MTISLEEHVARAIWLDRYPEWKAGPTSTPTQMCQIMENADFVSSIPNYPGDCDCESTWYGLRYAIRASK